ncbi:MAG: GTP 3',8-cyclase MoaA [Cytophagaceae bacterium]|nr:GTP 3',8-cyclase MoaA [Cytophagaceae bacterium]
MSSQSLLFDNHGRPLSYLRLAVTDRCNLRCFYCMPEEGVRYLPKSQVLSFEEMERLVRVLVGMGINKVRITGGEPFVRQDLMAFLRKLRAIEGLDEIALTTNGVLTAPHLPELNDLGIRSINLSLDTLDRQRFLKITRRDEFDRVRQTLDALLEQNFDVKINAVVMEGQNTDDLHPLTELTRQYPLSVRFIEEMPFNGEGSHYPKLIWNYRRILDELQQFYPDLQKLPDPAFSTAAIYQVPGYAGTVGIIAAFSRTFCGTCNRIRLTAQGELKTCLYQHGGLQIRDQMRNGLSDEQLAGLFLSAFKNRPFDGFEAERLRPDAVHESMTTIGG